MQRDPLPAAAPAAERFDASYIALNGWQAESFGRFTRSEALAFAAELADARAHARCAPRAVLEIGFGNGAFLGWCRAVGHGAVGIEVNPVAIERGRAAGFAVHESIAALPAEMRFDVALAFDVFEHLEPDALLALIASMHDRLLPGGVILARFPNGDSPFGRVNQHGDLTHRTALGSGRIRHLAALAGLELVACRAPRVPLRGVDPLRLAKRIALRAGRALVQAPLRWLYFEGRPIVFDANMVALLRRAHR